MTNTVVALHTLEQIRCEDSNRFPFDFGIIAILITCLSLFYVLCHHVMLNCLLRMKKSMPKPLLESKHNCDQNVTTSSTSKPHPDAKLTLGKPFRPMVRLAKMRNSYCNISNNHTNPLHFDLTISLITFGKMDSRTYTALGGYLLKFSMCIMNMARTENC